MKGQYKRISVKTEFGNRINNDGDCFFVGCADQSARNNRGQPLQEDASDKAEDSEGNIH